MRKPTVIGFIPKKVVKKEKTNAENTAKIKDAENTANSGKENSEE